MMAFQELFGLILIFIYLWSLTSDFRLVPRLFRKKKDIRGQIILITGAGSGVGRQLALEFSKYYTRLVLLDINREFLLETEKLLNRRSCALFIYECDVSDPRKVKEVAERIKREVGDVDIVVNNAGIFSGKYLMDLTDNNIVKTMEVNALAHFWICRAFLPAMMTKNKGHIVSIVSVVGRIVGSQCTDYCSSKFAAEGFAECLEIEMRQKKLDGIKVTVVYPSIIDTGLLRGAKMTLQSPLNPQFVAEEIVTGVLEERETIILPPFWKFIFIFKELVPRWFLIWCMRITDNLNAMTNFTGKYPERNEHELHNGTLEKLELNH